MQWLLHRNKKLYLQTDPFQNIKTQQSKTKGKKKVKNSKFQVQHKQLLKFQMFQFSREKEKIRGVKEERGNTKCKDRNRNRIHFIIF